MERLAGRKGKGEIEIRDESEAKELGAVVFHVVDLLLLGIFHAITDRSDNFLFYLGSSWVS